MKADVWRPLTTPTTTKEAFAQDLEGWTAAYREDFQAKASNGAFEFVKRRPQMIVHKLGWAHKLLWNDDNTLAGKRARLVGRGYSQVQGRDYISSYSATPRATAVRIFQAAVCSRNLEDEHCDVVKAFTQNDIDDVELYVEQPIGLTPTLDDEGKPMVMRVLKALEGFKQSGNLHQLNHSGTLTAPNDVCVFEQVTAEPTRVDLD